MSCELQAHAIYESTFLFNTLNGKMEVNEQQSRQPITAFVIFAVAITCVIDLESFSISLHEPVLLELNFSDYVLSSCGAVF